MPRFIVTGNLADIHRDRIYPATITVENGRISAIEEDRSGNPYPGCLLPGFIDSHVHIESSMLVPSEFARLAVVHGTVGTVSDPHEIANVCGLDGVEFMIENGKTVPFKFNFGAPSCVPATIFETAGAALNADEVERLLGRADIKYLSEMMNFPGVLNKDPEVMKKIAAAHQLGKPVDGHAPGLRGDSARAYIAAGISTDHECFTAEEALDKLRAGMKIIIREGSAARNFDALIGLLNDWPDQVMFCSDDKHPDSLLLGHINSLCARAVKQGINLFKILKAACLNPVLHYKLDIGLLRVGDPADFIRVRNLESFEVLETYINGQKVAEAGRSLIRSQPVNPVNRFSCLPKTKADFYFPWQGENEIHAIEALDGQLITNRISLEPAVREGNLVSDASRDLLKIVVVNRYHQAPVAKAFIRSFGLKKGALASSVAHDSHNIVAVGADDESICRAVNLVIGKEGGISAVSNDREMNLGLPVGGLMSAGDGYEVAAAYTEIDRMAREDLGSSLNSPFMTLSFMALLVIPHLKLSDKGLFDGDQFQFVYKVE
ncbi:MAG: adenine deaminase [Chitinophagaceae bacterium]